MAGNEITIEARLGTGKLEGDAARATSVINKIFGSGQASGGSRPASAPAMGYTGGGLSQADQIAKAESKAKVAKYAGDSSSTGFGGLGGGGVNAGGTKTFQINRAVINIQQAKINTGARRGGGSQSPESSMGAIEPQPVSASPIHSPTTLAQIGNKFQGGYMHGEQAMNTFFSGSMTGIAHLGMRGVGAAYSHIQEKRATQEAVHAQKASGSHPEGGATEESKTSNRESNSRLTSAAAAVPLIGALTGGIIAAAQKMGEAHIGYITSQMQTLGQVGRMSAGGGGAIGQLGYSAAAKGQSIMQAQQHMTGTAFNSTTGKGGGALEGAFGFSAKFGHSQGMGAAGGMIMAAQIAEMQKVDNHGKGGSFSAGSSELSRIAGYGANAGIGQRRLGQFAQGVVGLAQQQQLGGGVADTSAIAHTTAAIAGHGASLAQAQHSTQTLSGMMSAGSQSGSPISGMLMMAAAQKGGSLDDIIKASEKGITGGGIKDLQSMLPPEMMKYVLMGQTGKLGEAEHITQGIYGEAKTKQVTDRDLGFNQGNLASANKFAFHVERIGEVGESFANKLMLLNKVVEGAAVKIDWAMKKMGL